MEIVIPYQPRPWQADVHSILERFTVLVIHRRAGKTVLAINELIRRMVTKAGSVSAYICPQYAQARRVAWPYLREFAGVIPGADFNASELKLTLPNGSRCYLLGAENPDPIRGMGLDFFVFDEVAQCPERAWREVVRPACADRQGGGIFIGTPMGMGNLFYRLFSEADAIPGWCRKLLTVEHTDSLDPDELAALRREMSEEEYAQEMLCDWSAAVKGAFYGKQMAEAERDGRITRVPYDPALPVHTAWDLGVSDSTIVLMLQSLSSGEVRMIDSREYQNTGLPDIANDLQKLPYTWGNHYAPHDIKVREWGGNAESRFQTAEKLGLRFTVAPNKLIRDGIEAVRVMIPRMWFDRDKCFQTIEALKTYRAEYNDLRQVYSLSPLHSWESHYADALRIFAVAHSDERAQRLDYSQFNRRII